MSPSTAVVGERRGEGEPFPPPPGQKSVDEVGGPNELVSSRSRANVGQPPKRVLDLAAPEAEGDGPEATLACPPVR